MDFSTNPINKLVDCKLSESAIGYTKVLEHYAAYLWGLATTYPGCTVNSYIEDVCGAFPQLTHNPDIARGNVSLYGDKMIVLVALYFGGKYGPAKWEPIGQAQYFLTQWMFKHTTCQT